MVTCRCDGPCAALAAVLARLDVLEARRSSRLSQADQDRLGRLLPVLAGAFGSAEFLTREVLAHESVGLHLVVRDLSARSLGRLLRRAAGVPVGGLLVERLGQADGAVLWRVVNVVS